MAKKSNLNNTDFDFDQFIRDRDEALLSLDADKIEAYCQKYQIKFPRRNNDLFWLSIHKAITGNRHLPIEFRRQSKKYLEDHGMKSLDETL